MNVWRHARATWDLFCFRPQAVAQFDASGRAALGSFALWLLVWPCGVYDSYSMDSQFLAASGVTPARYIGLRSLQLGASAVLPFLPVWVMCRWAGLQDRFPLLVTTQNWQIAFWAIGGFLANVLTRNSWFDRNTLVNIGISLFLLQLFYAWYACRVVLRCNPFYAAGMATLLFMVASTTGDLLHIYLFGTARPFFTLGVTHAE